LYNPLPREFREKFSKFYKALVMRDEKYVEEYCKELGIDDHKLYASLILMQNYDTMMQGHEIQDMFQNGKFSTKEWEQWEKLGKEHNKKFRNIAEKMPFEMNLILRSSFILGSINAELGVLKFHMESYS
jgi:aarF domain-containing kinase